MKHLKIFIIAIFCLSSQAFAEDHPSNPDSFPIWLQKFEQDALAKGISQDTINEAFANTSPIDRVIELDQKQPESVLSISQYLDNVVTKKRVKDGKAHLSEYKKLLTKVGNAYGVQPRFIVALWGIETGYGHNTGNFQTIDVLATLAYDGRRSEFFRGELMDALKILQDEDMPADDMKGSWAGAIGQCQFMPSTYLKYAVDYNHDGKRDIWDTQSDVFASIANYLKKLGWNSKEGWGREVTLPDGFNMDLADISKGKSLSEWRKLGVHKADGKSLPASKAKAYLIMVGSGDDAIPYIVYGNYKALLEWNRSRFFATAVGTLADKIGQ